MSDQDKDVTPVETVNNTSRKGFLKTGGVVALGAAAIAVGTPALAEAAKPYVTRDESTVTLTFSRGSVTTGHDFTQDLLNKFTKQTGIKVKSLFAPVSSTDTHNLYVAQLSGGSTSVDLYDCDVIWPPQFAAAGWVLPVDKYIPDSFKKDLLPGPLLGTKVNGKIYAFPNRTDSGLLAYRTDLLAKYKFAPPQTWNDIIRISQTIIKHEKGVPYGILWQGAQYEGLFCNICELFWQNGGNVLQNYSGSTVVIDSPNNRAALQFMVDSIHKYNIAPVALSTYKEDDCRHLFEQGKSVFMRNWPYIWGKTASNDPKASKVAGKFKMIPLPHGPSGKSAGALGGWNYAINAKSKNPDAAVKLALFLTSYESQKFLTINSGTEPTLDSLYHDEAVLNAVPYFKQFYPVVRGALPRPVSKYETQISDRVTKQVNSAIKGQISVAEALKNAQRDVQSIVGGGSNTP